MVKVVYTCKSRKYGLNGSADSPRLKWPKPNAVAVQEALNK